MKSICNEEKSLKRYLKNHISLNIETMVKFLITGIIAISLTACGGGGGGGSDSSDPVPPVVKPEDPNMGKPEDSILPEIGVDKAWDLEKEVQKLDGEKFTQLLSEGKIYEKDGKYYVVIDEENKVAQEVVVDPNMGKPEDSILPEIGVDKAWDLKEGVQELEGSEFNKLLSEGKIYEKDGKYYIIVDEENKVAQEVSSKSNITGEQDVILEESKEHTDSNTALYKVSNSTVTVSEETTLAVKGDKAAAIYAVDSIMKADSLGDRTTVVENKGIIEVTGHNSVGMVSKGETTKVINSGTIIGISENREDNKTYIHGIAAVENGLAENNGSIKIEGTGIAMLAKDKGTVENSGTIVTEGNGIYLTDSEGNILKDIKGTTGITAENGAVGINSGKIENIGSFNYGMYAKNEGTIINNGEIKTNSSIVYVDDSGFDSITGEFIEERGMGFSFESLMEGRENSYIENNGSLTGEGSVFGIVSRFGSEGVNKGDINLTGKVEKYEGTEEILNNEDGTHMVSFAVGMRARDNATSINEGNINIIGGAGRGIDVRRQSEGVNKGNIYLESSEYTENYTTIDETGEQESWDEIEHTWLSGMQGSIDSKVLNEKNISLKGRGTAIGVYNKSEGINKGELELESMEYQEPYSWVDGEGVEHTKEETNHTWLSGMEAYSESKVTNEKNIYLKGTGTGLRASENSEGINNGTIIGESIIYNASTNDSNGNEIQEERETWISGIQASKNSTIENNGIIQILGSGKGMEIFNDSEGVNNNLITLEGKNVTGAEIGNSSKFINSENGIIEVKGTEHYAAGIGTSNYWSEDQKLETSIIENHGKIRVEKENLNSDLDYYAGASVIGINAHGVREYDEAGNIVEVGMVEVSNTGLIHVVGDRGVGISVENGKVVNSGEILLEGKNTTALRLGGIGKLVNTVKLEATGAGIIAQNWDIRQENNIVENEGEIIVTGNGELIKNTTGNYYNQINAAKGIEGNGADIYNSGNIIATGDGAYLEYENGSGIAMTSSRAAQGIYVTNSTVIKNDGNITVTGEGADLNNGATGIYASGKSSYDSSLGESKYEKVNIENSGTIKVDGAYATGISVNMGELINTGKIDITGMSSVGISSSNNYNSTVISKLENEGDITVTGDGGTKKNPYSNYYSSTDAAKGINSSSGDVYNSGNIMATGNGAYLEYEADHGTSWTASKAAQGIYASNAGVVKNKGNITVVGDGKDNWNAAVGIYASGKNNYDSSLGESTYEKVNVENSGTIKVDGAYAQGISVNMGELINTGKIDVTGTSSVGISSTNNSNSTVISKLENEGDITVTGDGEIKKDLYGNFYSVTDAAKGIDSSSGDVYNSGNIAVTGNGAYLEYETDHGTSWTASKAAQGIYASNAGIVKNTGNITVIGEGVDLTKGATGIYAIGRQVHDSSSVDPIFKKVKVDNSGDLRVDGAYAQGIVVELGDLINTGKVDVNGIGSVGLKVGFSNAYPAISSDINKKIENEGDITVTGDGTFIKIQNSNNYNSINAAIGIEGRAVDIYNSGKIDVTGDAKYINDYYPQVTLGVRGIKIENPFYGGDTLPANKILENFGEIVLSGKGQIKGIETSGVDILNTGNITINNGRLETNGVSYGHTLGIDASAVKNFKNTGNIQIIKEGDETYLGATGIKIASSPNSIDIKTFENTGSIDILATNGVGIETDGNIVNTGNININGEKGIGLKLSDFSYSDTKIENEGDITIQGNSGIGIYANKVNNSGNITLIGDNSVGIKSNTSGEINHKGQIVIEGNDSYGVISSGNLNLDGKIIMTGDNNTGIVFTNWSSLSSSGLSTVELTGKGVLGAKYSVENIYERDLNLSIKIDGGGTGLELERGDLNFKGEIIIDGSFDSKGSVGILTKNNYSINNSNGYINMYGKDMIGIKAEGSSNVINGESAYINVSGENALGIVSEVNQYSWETPEIKNDGLIIIHGNSGYDLETSEIVTGIRGFNYGYNKGIITNNGKIEVESSNDARGIDSFGNDVINNGIISIKGNGITGGVDLNGIRVQGLGATATNNGTINVDGLGAWGMYAGIAGTAINSKEGVINVSATAEGGMIASGGTAINHGTINIEAGNSNTNIVEVDKNGNEIIKSAMYATNGGTIENYGTINSNGNLTLGSSNGGVYMIGTSEDGSYGKITAKNVSIDGDVVVSAGITKNGFKNEYTMQNVVDAEDIKLGDNFNFTSNSLLYDAEAVTDRWGNLDATLSRNDKTLSDFTTGYITSTADIFGKYQNEESFKTLSSDAKEVVKVIDTSSAEAIDRSLNDLTPTIYSNLGRQMLETSETFKEQDMVAINSLGENSYNFTFIGEYQDIDSRDNIEGYKSKMSGFVGAMSFGDGTFGTVGYGYNAIDYKDNGKGHIQTIHLGLNRFMKYQGVDFRLGLGGEYNFHENKRDMDLVNRRAESDFDSYGVRASGEVSKIFGEKAFVKPYLGFDLAHMKYDSFTESNANSLNANIESENYTSVLPKVGLVVGDRFGGLNLFAGVEYSYELGNMDKEQEFSYEGFSGKGKLPKDDLECGTTGVKAGASYEVNNFTLGASVGKNFGRRDNSFVNASIGYKF